MTTMGLRIDPQWNAGGAMVRGQLPDHREQHPLLLRQVRLEVDPELGETVGDIVELGMPPAVHALNLVHEAVSRGSSSQR